jgi:hypothetical protein
VYPDDTLADPVPASESLALVGDDTVEMEFWAAVRAFEEIWDEKIDVVARGWVEAVGYIFLLYSFIPTKGHCSDS